MEKYYLVFFNYEFSIFYAEEFTGYPKIKDVLKAIKKVKKKYGRKKIYEQHLNILTEKEYSIIKN